MRTCFAMLAVTAGLWCSPAEAQTVYVPHGGRVVAVPIAAGAPSEAAPTEGGLLRIDALPKGAVLSVDGRALGGPAELSGGWIALPPGPHFLDVALPGGGAVRLTVTTPGESSGYQVVPQP